MFVLLRPNKVIYFFLDSQGTPFKKIVQRDEILWPNPLITLTFTLLSKLLPSGLIILIYEAEELNLFPLSDSLRMGFNRK